MGQLIMVAGGAKSGKSEYAESLFSVEDAICYLATGIVRQPDAEMALRIEHHQARRSAKWTTEERYQHVAQFISKTSATGILLDDATLLTTNLFFDLIAQLNVQHDGSNVDLDLDQLTKSQMVTIEQTILSEWQHILKQIMVYSATTVIVTNEVGLGLVPATKLSRLLRDYYGQVNQLIAKVADQVYLVRFGLPQQLKG